MLRVIGCLTGEHDLRLVALAVLLCLFSCTTAISMLWRSRMSNGQQRVLWLCAAGAVAGCGIWATHFVAMLAFQPGFTVGYDAGLTLLSIAVAMVLCGFGFALALQEGFELIGGVLTGFAVSAMHYVGMAALHIPADQLWDYSYIAASVVIGLIGSAAAMAVIPRRGGALPLLKAGSLFTLGICGMHFTGMAAVTFIPNPAIDISGAVLDPAALAISVAAGAIFIVGLGLTGVFVDSHLSRRMTTESDLLRAHIQELEATKALLQNSTQNLAVALAAADAANRAKSQFVAVMSHELRTPLNAVIGFADMMLQETFGPLGHPRYHHYLEDIRDSGAHLLSLINNVLDLSKMDTGGLELDNEDVSVPDIIADVLRSMSYQAKTAGIALTAEVEPNLPLLRADRKRVRQMLTNLTANALKFTPIAGTVRIAARLDGAELALSVADTGIGIAPEDMQKALDRFGQVDSGLSRRYEGAGLGLPLAKLLMQAHGGRLEITSKVEAGTIVTAIFPGERLITEQQAA